MAQKVYLKKSSVVDKTPSANGLDFGELAINYASGTGKSFLATKKYNGTIAKFHEDAYNEATFASKGDLSLVQSDIAEIKPNYVTKAQLNAASGAAVSSAYTMAVNYVNQAVSGLSIGDYLTVASASSVFSEINSQLSEMANSAVVESKISALTKTVEDNEYVVAQAFNDLNDRVDGIDERIGDFSGEFLTVSSASSVFADMGSSIQEAKDKAQSAYTYATIISGSVYSKSQTDSAIATAKNAGVTSAYNAAVATASAYTDSRLSTVNASVSELEGKITAVSATVKNTYWTSATTQSKIATAKAEAHASAAGSAKTYTDNALAVVSAAANTGIAEVKEGLTTTNNSVTALSAGVKTMLSTVYTYKGTVANFASLPDSGKVTGYVYNVEAANGNTPAGTNYAWNGNAWDALGGSVDLSAYAKTTDVDEVEESLNGFKTWFGTASGTLATKALVSTTSGNAVTAANAYTDAHISGFTSGNFLTVASAASVFSDINQSIDNVSKKVDGVSATVKSTYWTSGTTQTKINDAKNAAVTSAFTAASAVVKTLSGNVVTAISTVGSDISNVSTKVDAVSATVKSTYWASGTTQSKITEAKNAAVTSAFTAASAVVKTLSGNVVNAISDVNSNITNVDNKLAAASATVTNNYVTKTLLNTTSGNAVAVANAYTDAHISGFTSGNFLTVASATSVFSDINQSVDNVSTKVDAVSATVKNTYWTSSTTQTKINDAKNAAVTSAFTAASAVVKTLSGNVVTALSTIGSDISNVSSKVDAVSATVKNTYWTSGTTQSKIAEAKNAAVNSAYTAASGFTKQLSGNVVSALADISSQLGTFVTTGTAQEISGVKTFTAVPVFSNGFKITNASTVTATDYRGIPYSETGDATKIRYVNSNVYSGLTYNPKYGLLRTGGFVITGKTGDDLLTADGKTKSANSFASSGALSTLQESVANLTTNVNAMSGAVAGDYATKTEASEYAAAALGNSMSYTDSKVAGLSIGNYLTVASASSKFATIDQAITNNSNKIDAVSATVTNNFATVANASSYAAAALSNAMDYTDSKVAGLSIGNYLTVASASSKFSTIDQNITANGNIINAVSATVKNGYWTSATTQTKINDAKNAGVTSAYTASTAYTKQVSGYLATAISTLSQSITNNDNKINAVSATVKSTYWASATTQSKINDAKNAAVTSAFTAASAVVKTLSGNVVNAISTVASNIVALSSNTVSAINGVYKVIEDNEEVTAAALNELNDDLDNLSSAFETLNGSVTSISNTVNTVTGTVGTLSEDVATLKSSAATLNDKITLINGRYISAVTYTTAATTTSIANNTLTIPKPRTLVIQENDAALSTAISYDGTVALTAKTYDKKVEQASNTAANFRPILLGNNNHATAGSIPTTTATAGSVFNIGIYAQPSTKKIFAAGFQLTSGGTSLLTANGGSVAQSTFAAATRKVNGHALSADVTVTLTDLGIGNVENTKLSTWTGNTSIKSVGTITAGTWNGTNIALNKLASSAITIDGTSTALGGSVTTKNVLQTNSTEAKRRPLLLGISSAATGTALATTTQTGQSFFNASIYAIPSTGKLYAGGYALTGGGTNLLTADGGSVAQNTFATSTSLTGYVPTTRKVNGHALSADVTVTLTDLGIGNVENTKLSTWTGNTSIKSVGTITAGTWNGTKIANAYLANNSVAIDGQIVALGTSATTKNVVQSNSTATTFRPIILGATSNATPANLTATTTGQVYVNKGIYAQPSTAKIFAAGFQLTGGGTSLLTANGRSVAQSTFVAATRKVNGHALSADVTVTLTDLGIGNVENTKLSTWTGNTSIKSVGTITAGTWNGTNIALNKLASSAITIDGTATALGGSITTKNVTQTNNTGAQYRPLLLGNNNHTTAGSIPTTTATAGTVFNIGIYAQPSTKKLFAAGFQLTAGTANILLGDGSSEARSNFATSSITHNEIVAAVANAAQKINVTADAATKHYLLGMAATGEMNSASTHLSSTGVYWENSNLYATSDERLKDFTGDVEVDFDKLKSIPKKYFKWKSEGPQGKTDIGTSAQKVLALYPELVSGSEDSYYGVAYDKLSILALAAIDKLHEENEELKSEIKELKERLRNLEK